MQDPFPIWLSGDGWAAAMEECGQLAAEEVLDRHTNMRRNHRAALEAQLASAFLKQERTLPEVYETVTASREYVPVKF